MRNVFIFALGCYCGVIIAEVAILYRADIVETPFAHKLTAMYHKASMLAFIASGEAMQRLEIQRDKWADTINARLTEPAPDEEACDDGDVT